MFECHALNEHVGLAQLMSAKAHLIYTSVRISQFQQFELRKTGPTSFDKFDLFIEVCLYIF